MYLTQKQLVFFSFLILLCAPLNAKGQPTTEPFRSSSITEKRLTQPVAQKPKSLSRRITPPSDGAKNRESTSGTKQKANGLGSIWTTLGSLALIIGLILLVAKLFKKNGSLSSGGLPREAIEILGRQPIDARQSIHLIRLGSRILVVGSSAEGMRTLTEIDDPVEVDYLAGVCQNSQEKSPFTNAFRTFFTQTDDSNQQSQSSHRSSTSAVEVTPNQQVVDQYEHLSMQDQRPQNLNVRESSSKRNRSHG